MYMYPLDIILNLSGGIKIIYLIKNRRDKKILNMSFWNSRENNALACFFLENKDYIDCAIFFIIMFIFKFRNSFIRFEFLTQMWPSGNKKYSPFNT